MQSLDEFDDVHAALADPSRRAVLTRLARDGEGTATTIAAGLPISRQAVIKHLAALDRARLVRARRQGREVRWDWAMYNASALVQVKEAEPHERIRIEWASYGGTTSVEWRFTSLAGGTFVSITESGFAGDAAAIANGAIESTEAFAMVLAGLKALLEHGVRLNLVGDRFPPGLAAE